MPVAQMTPDTQGPNDGFSYFGGATNYLGAVGLPFTSSKYGGYNTTPHGAANAYMTGLPASAVVVTKVEVYIWHQRTGTAPVPNIHTRLSGVNQFTAAEAAPLGTWGMSSAIAIAQAPGGLAWTPTRIRNTAFGIQGNSTTSGWWYICYQEVYVTYLGIAQYISMIRDILSRILRYRARAPKSVSFSPFVALAAWPPLTDVAASHRDFAPSGAGVERHARPLLALQSLELDVDRMEVVRADLLDLSRFRVADWDTCYSPEDAFDASAHGVARLSRGERLYSRTDPAWILDPVDQRIVECGQDLEKRSADGLLLEAARTQANTRSSFVSQLTGITTGGTGVNGSAITAVSDELWFESTISGYAMKMLAGNPHTTDLTARFPDTASYGANSVICVWARYRTEGTSEGLKLRIQRLIDNWYWNDGTAAWQAGAVEVEFAAATTRTKAATKPIDVGAGATLIRVIAVIPAGGTASRVVRVFHVQVENGPYPTSDIVADNAAVTRNADALTLTNNFGKRTVPNDHGTARQRIKPLFNASDLAAGDVRVFFDAYYDASNYQRLYYDKTAGQLIFRRRVGGSNYDATIAWAPVRDQQYDIACRWTGPEGELDLTAYTLSVFVDGTKGTDVVASGAIHPTPANATLYVGNQQGGSNHADCYFLLRETAERVLTDEEIVDL